VAHNNRVIEEMNERARAAEKARRMEFAMAAQQKGKLQKYVQAPQHANRAVDVNVDVVPASTATTAATATATATAAAAATKKKITPNKKGLPGKTLGLNNKKKDEVAMDDGGEAGGVDVVKQARPRRKSAQNVKKVVEEMESDNEDEDSGGSEYQGEDSGEEV